MPKTTNGTVATTTWTNGQSAVFSAGTDGTDGPTDAAGAVADSGTMTGALSMNEDPISYLAGFDSFNFFRKVGGLITTGPTFTNVMDIVVVIVE